jgi:hypothetical protein
MSYLLALLLLGAVAFIGVLYRKRLAPQALLYKVASRFVDPPQSWKLEVRDAPYRRTETSGKALHRPVLLNLETSDGSGQACHPDVVYIPGGFGEGGWRYWMVCTPYPYFDSHLENPEIFVSDDGVTWAVPEGLQNPLCPPREGPGDHNSDPDMLFHAGALWLFYRLTLRSKTPAAVPDENRIYLMRSADGVRWSAPVEILSDQRGRQLLSPAVTHDGTHFLMWTVEIMGNELKIVRRASVDGLLWGHTSECRLSGLQDGRQPWHIDVIQEDDRFSAMLVSCTGLGGSGGRIHYAHSEDHGLTWRSGDVLLEQVYEFETKLQYRATFRKTEREANAYEMWYSAASHSNMFSVAYLKLTRVGNRMSPYVGRPAELETFISAK